MIPAWGMMLVVKRAMMMIITPLLAKSPRRVTTDEENGFVVHACHARNAGVFSYLCVVVVVVLLSGVRVCCVVLCFPQKFFCLFSKNLKPFSSYNLYTTRALLCRIYPNHTARRTHVGAHREREREREKERERERERERF